MRDFGTRVLATYGNAEVVPAETQIWSIPSHPFEKPQLLIAPGNIFFYEKSKNETIGTDGLVAHKMINICVALPGNKTRCISGDGLYPTDIINYKATAPDCGVTPVWDILAKCANCDEPHSLRIMYRDNNTEQTKNPGQWDSVDLTGIVGCSSCVNCTAADYSRELMCEFVNQLKRKQGEYNKIGTFMGNLTPVQAVPKVVRLYPTSQRYCISLVNNGCANCTEFTAIKKIKVIPGEGDPVETTLTNYLAAGSSVNSGVAQLDGLVEQLNKATEVLGGSAILVGGVKGNCCDTMIEINHCTTVELYNADDELIEPCSEVTTLLDPVPNPYNCVDCSSTPGTTTYAHGLRVIFPPPTVNCEPCNIPIPGMNFYGYDVSVEATQGFKPGSYYVRESVASRLPVGLGVQYVRDEYRQVPTDYRGYNDHEGFLGNLTPDSRANQAITVACKSQYCGFHLAVGHKHDNSSANASTRAAKWRNLILVPTTDTVTLLSLQPYLNILAAQSPYIADDVNVICYDGQTVAQQYQVNGKSITE